MAEPAHLALLGQGHAVWNPWRQSNPTVIPDLRAARLVRSDLRGIDLHAARLERASLIRAKLQAANLSEAVLEDAVLIEVDLSEAELVAARFARANLANAVLRRARLARAVFEQAILTVADLRETDCRGADFRRADLREAALRGADLSEARFDEALLHGTRLEGADLSLAHGLTADQIRVATLDAGTRLPERLTEAERAPEDLETLRQQLRALRTRLPQDGRARESDLTEFHGILTRLGSLGHDVARFRVPEEALGSEVRSWEYTSGGAAFEMDEVRSLPASRLVTQIEAVLRHLNS